MSSLESYNLIAGQPGPAPNIQVTSVVADVKNGYRTNISPPLVTVTPPAVAVNDNSICLCKYIMPEVKLGASLDLNWKSNKILSNAAIVRVTKIEEDKNAVASTFVEATQLFLGDLTFVFFAKPVGATSLAGTELTYLFEIIHAG